MPTSSIKTYQIQDVKHLRHQILQLLVRHYAMPKPLLQLPTHTNIAHMVAQLPRHATTAALLLMHLHLVLQIAIRLLTLHVINALRTTISKLRIHKHQIFLLLMQRVEISLTHSTSHHFSPKLSLESTIVQQQSPHHRTPAPFMTMTVQPVELHLFNQYLSNLQQTMVSWSNTSNQQTTSRDITITFVFHAQEELSIQQVPSRQVTSKFVRVQLRIKIPPISPYHMMCMLKTCLVHQPQSNPCLGVNHSANHSQLPLIPISLLLTIRLC